MDKKVSFDPLSSVLTVEQKKEKNKENSRKTRLRKKNYIDRLESKVKHLEEEVATLKRENEYYKSKERILSTVGKD